MVFQRRLSDSKSFQVSTTLLSTLADLSNAVVWMIFARPTISTYSSSLAKPLGAVPNVEIRIGITITLIFSGKVLVHVSLRFL